VVASRPFRGCFETTHRPHAATHLASSAENPAQLPLQLNHPSDLGITVNETEIDRSIRLAGSVAWLRKAIIDMFYLFLGIP